jgi:hypothetical protein
MICRPCRTAAPVWRCWSIAPRVAVAVAVLLSAVAFVSAEPAPEPAKGLALGASTVGLLGSPSGQGPLLAGPALFAGRTKEVKATGRFKPQDLPVLQKVFGNRAVTVLTDGGKGTAEGVTIVGVVELFGKLYLQVKDGAGKPALIRADTIVAIRVD